MGWRQGDLEDVDILLTTYNLISSTPEERRLFRVMPIQYVVFDEAHMLKNMSTIRYENLVKINVSYSSKKKKKYSKFSFIKISLILFQVIIYFRLNIGFF